VEAVERNFEIGVLFEDHRIDTLFDQLSGSGGENLVYSFCLLDRVLDSGCVQDLEFILEGLVEPGEETTDLIAHLLIICLLLELR
jgi:hypothetical protein